MVISPSLERNEDTLSLPDLPEWAALYLRDCELKRHSHYTLIHYRNGLKRFRSWYLTRITDGLIDRRNAKDFAFWLATVKRRYDDHPGRPTEDVELSPATVRRSVGVMRTFFTWLFEEYYLPRDFSSWFPFPPPAATPIKMISSDTLAALLHGAATGDTPIRDTSLVMLLADTGLRRKEASELRIDQVQYSDSSRRGILHNVEGKGDRLRDVPFSAVAGEALATWLERRVTIMDDLPETQQIYVNRYRRPLKPVGVYQVLRRCAERAGVEDEVWNTHSLRHNFATHFWREQRDTKSLSLILGHSSQKITEDIYVHPVPEDLLNAHTSVLSSGLVQMPVVVHSPPERPTKQILLAAIRENPNWTALGKQFQMSDVGIRKLAKRYDVLDDYYQARRLT